MQISPLRPKAAVALSLAHGEVLKQSLADNAGLDEDVISVKLALDVVAVLERGTMEMLIAAVAA